MNTEFSLIEQSFIKWKLSPQKTKENLFKLNKIDVTLIFLRGREVYSKNGWTTGVIPDRIYVTSSNNEQVKIIFNKIFAIESASSPRQIPLYHFVSNDKYLFELHYCANAVAIRTHIAETENKFIPKPEKEESCVVS